MWRSAKMRAKRKNIPFSIDVEDIAIPETCPVLGISLSRAGGKPGHRSPSLDRIVPEVGYVRGNVRVISHRANTLKLNATVSELEAILTDLRRVHA
jgi:hypothetical protein